METLETKPVQIQENLFFVNIIARRTYSHTPVEELQELNKLIAQIWGLNPGKPIDKIIINKILVNSVIYN